MYHVICNNHARKNTMYKCQCTSVSMKNVRTLLDYVHMTTYYRINGKHPWVPIIHVYIIIQFHIKRHFSARLSVRVSNSVQTIKCAIKYFINNTYHRLHHYIPERSTQHHTILHITKILHMKSFFMPACHLRRKISYETKLSHYTLLHPYTLHT